MREVVGKFGVAGNPILGSGSWERSWLTVLSLAIATVLILLSNLPARSISDRIVGTAVVAR